MWGSVLCIVFGCLTLLVAGFAKQFHAGLRPGARIPAWQGRLWFFISGALLLLAGLDGVLGPQQAGVRHSLERTFATMALGWEMFGAMVAVLVGICFLWPTKEKVDFRARLLGVVAVFGGLMFISDVLWKLKH